MSSNAVFYGYEDDSHIEKNRVIKIKLRVSDSQDKIHIEEDTDSRIKRVLGEISTDDNTANMIRNSKAVYLVIE
jgi:hypothetical protein